MSQPKADMSAEIATDDEETLISIYLEFGDQVPASSYVPRVRSNHFTDPDRQAIWRTIDQLLCRGDTPDAAAVRHVLVTSPEPVTPGVRSLLLRLASEGHPTSANVDRYAAAILSRFSEKHMGSIVRSLADKIDPSGGINPDEVRAALDDEISKGGTKPLHRWTDINTALLAYSKILEERFSSGSPFQGSPTGYPCFDATLGGICGGSLYTVAAGTSVGKTAFVVNLVSRILEHDPESSVAIASTEITVSEIVERFISNVAHVDIGKLACARLNESDFIKITRAQNSLARGKRLRMADSVFNIQDILSEGRQLAAEGATVFVVDFLQSINGDRSGNREREVGAMTTALKQLALKTGMAVIVLSQLNREYLKRPDGRPKLSDLRDSGGIEQDSNAVIFIHREAHLAVDKRNSGLAKEDAEIIIAKNRGGKTATIDFDWYGATGTFKEKEHQG